MNRNFSRFNLNRWLNQRQIQLLESAYQSAEEIKTLEDKYFQGNPINYRPESQKTMVDFVKSLRDRHLFNIRFNLAQFKINSFLLPQGLIDEETSQSVGISEAEIIEKLNFIDSIVKKYRDNSEDILIESLANPPNINSSNLIGLTAEEVKQEQNESASTLTLDPAVIAAQSNLSRQSQAKSWFNWGFFKGQKLTPNYEQQVVQELRIRRIQDKLAMRWLLILFLIPLLVQVTVKTIIFDPLLGNYSNKNPTKIELNAEIKQEFLREYSAFKESLEIQQLLGVIPKLSEDEKEEKLSEKVIEIWQESRNRALNGWKNILSDGVALLTFGGLVYFNRTKITIVRSFSNRTFLNLSDPLKVFLFILITDMFVGFHSAEGWEVLLAGVLAHFGLPESPVAINAFIATVPVIIDSCIKFWIFSYLTRYSPAASAIYERMNT
ncbi:CemA family protein [Planktothrix mougeotii]|uniref:CemA family protein n=1 Tax=Planktothrix mougeotii LEGE 06226 TaxID=1828728 RepID=A0ABR9UJ74_9CYAN|nr:CemA family protein [Planktothrix mougeotii]MBE9146512.1 CemA family protein [Planktothrix mougeotii LEGE 06226]